MKVLCEAKDEGDAIMEDINILRQPGAACGLFPRLSIVRKHAQVFSYFAGARRVQTIMGAVAILIVFGRSSWGGFDTIINVPPDLDNFSTIHSNTQVNVFDGGNIGDF